MLALLRIIADVSAETGGGPSPVTMAAVGMAAIAAFGAAWTTTFSYLDRRDQRKETQQQREELQHQREHNKGLVILKRRFKECFDDRESQKTQITTLQEQRREADTKAARMEGQIVSLTHEATELKEEVDKLRKLYWEKAK